jgi:LacI family transcriptional regulator
MPKSKRTAFTIRDVAREAGVSVATVSRFINRNAPVSDEVAERIQKIMQSLHYVPQATARNLATHRTRTIGLLLRDISGDFFAPLLNGIETVTSQSGYDLLISGTRQSLPRHVLTPSLGPQNTDGLLVFSDSLSEKRLAELAVSGFPVVLIHRTPPEPLKIPCVTIENKAASKKIVEHLITVHNRHKILFLRGPAEQEDSYWRELGYRQALAMHGIAFDPRLVTDGGFDRNIAHAAIQKMVAAGVEYDGVFTGDDEAAVGVLAALADAGVRVPEEVSVVGYDDQRMSPYLTPPLTTVRAPTEEVGQEAVRQLLKLIAGETLATTMTLLPVEIVIRRSCGCE